jgi:hypothetical protein
MSLLFNRLKKSLIFLNLFDNKSQDEKIISCQRWATRIFLFLFSILTIAFLIYTSISEQITEITKNSPSESEIDYLFKNHGNTLNCPCTQIAISHKYLINHHIDHHQVS